MDDLINKIRKKGLVKEIVTQALLTDTINLRSEEKLPPKKPF